MEDKVTVKFLTGEMRLAPTEYFTWDVAAMPADIRLGMHAAGIVRVAQDGTLPAGVWECRSAGQVISRLDFT